MQIIYIPMVLDRDTQEVLGWGDAHTREGDAYLNLNDIKSHWSNVSESTVDFKVKSLYLNS